MRRLVFLVAAGASLSLALPMVPWLEGGVREAHAAVSISLSLDELVFASGAVVLAVPEARESRWEQVGKSRRIVTYTRFSLTEALKGEPGSTFRVRTLGGAVDGIGQAVSGEASFTLGEPALLFLSEREGVLSVTGLAQGHYRVLEGDQGPRLAPSPDGGTVVQRRGPAIAAQEVLIGARIEEAKTRIRQSIDRAARPERNPERKK